MANTSSAKKATRKIARRTAVNKNRRSRMRTFVRKVEEALESGDKAAAEANAPKVYAMIDKLAKIGVIHKNKAANLKSGIAVYINKLS